MRNDGTAWQVIIVEPCLSWLHDLRRSDRLTLIQISQAITVLAEEGPGLGRPLVDTVSGSKLPNLKELRPGSAGYKTAIPRAEDAYAEHLRIEGKK